jgi:hypothetical protein
LQVSFDRFLRRTATTQLLWREVGAVPPGSSKQVDAILSLENVRAIAEGAPVWLVVYAGDEGIGSPVGRSADSSSVEIYRATTLENRDFARQVAAAIPESRRTGGRR